MEDGLVTSILDDLSVIELFEDLNRETHKKPNENCNLRAGKLAKAMSDAGRIGKVMKIISGEVIGCLIPIIPDTKNWKFHYVCIEGDRVYDPCVGVPLNKEEYVRCMFPQQEVRFVDCLDVR